MSRSVTRELLAASGCLLAATALVGIVSYGMLWRLGLVCAVSSVAWATLAVCVAFVPPLWFEVLIGQSAAGPLATVAWRLGVLLPAVLLSRYEIEAERNCAQVTLLACYLMILPLESWLLIRQSRPS